MKYNGFDCDDFFSGKTFFLQQIMARILYYRWSYCLLHCKIDTLQMYVKVNFHILRYFNYIRLDETHNIDYVSVILQYVLNTLNISVKHVHVTFVHNAKKAM